MLSCKERKCAQASCVNEKNVLHCLEGWCCSSIFLCFSVELCIYCCVIHSHFLQSYLLPCNWLFSRRQTFLSKDTNVCSVVMDMLGIPLLSLAPLLLWFFFFFLFCTKSFSLLRLAKHASYTCRLVTLEMIFTLEMVFWLGWFSLLGPFFFFFFLSSVVKLWPYWQLCNCSPASQGLDRSCKPGVQFQKAQSKMNVSDQICWIGGDFLIIFLTSLVSAALVK